MTRLRVVQLAGCLCLMACTVPKPQAGSNGPERSALVRGGANTPRKHNFLGTFTPSTAQWTLRRQRPGWPEGVFPSGAGGAWVTDQTFTYGASIDTPLVGDWDGDGTETQGIFRPQDPGQPGFWALANTLGGGVSVQFFFGMTGDQPIVGDWNGDGITTPGVYRAGTFLLRDSNSDGPENYNFTFGAAGDIPLAGDWDGDGKDGVGVYRPSTSTFYLSNVLASSHPPDITLQFGDHDHVPIVGDWNEDGVSTIGIVNQGFAYLTNNMTSGTGEIRVPLGTTGDIPVAGNWNPKAPAGASTAPSTFFPLGVWSQPSSSFSKWTGRGINTVVYAPEAESIDTWTAAATQQGLKMIRQARPNPADDLAEFYLLGWFLTDQPDVGGQAAVPEWQAKYQALRSFHSSLPIMLDLKGDTIDDPLDGTCNGPGDYPAGDANLRCYLGFLRTSDWILFNFYPMNFGQGKDVFTVSRMMDKLARWSPKPQFPRIEAGGPIYNAGSTPPTPDQFRAQIWLAIIHGARGLIYYPQSNCFQTCVDDSMTAALATEMTTQNQRIADIGPALETAINPSATGFRSGLPLQATWRQVGSTRYFIVLNGSASSLVNKSMTITGFFTPSSPFTVVGENRTKPASTTITDNFGPYEVHVYRTP